MRRVVLLSGGLDSAVVLADARRNGQVCALSVDYGQRNVAELGRAIELAKRYDCVDYRVASIHPFVSALGAAGPGADDGANIVPGRNLILLSLACAYAQQVRASEVLIGCNADDATVYPDCTPEFLDAVWLTQRNTGGPEVVAPLRGFTKRQVVEMARKLGVPIGSTLSCYNPGHDGAQCGKCAACKLRKAAGA